MKKFNLWDTVCGWVVFAIAATVYLLTIEPTASFWDCGEFISSAHKLDVGHPPGAPFFMLMGHFASLFAMDNGHVAMCVNAMSALASAFTILFLFWTITALAKRLVKPDTLWKGIGVLMAGAVGALAYTFSDTFWFSAVEGEVYASSSLFTAIVFWLILKWDEQADEAGSDKWLILIAYLMGLSIGVHLLNLLTIPAIVLVYYFRRYSFSWKGVCVAFLASVAILAFILYGIIPGFPTVAGWFELLFVNGLGCPFNTGLAVYIVLTIIALGVAIWLTARGGDMVRPGDRTSITAGETPASPVGLTTPQIVSFVCAFALSGAAFLFEKWWMGVLISAALVGVLFWKKQVVPARLLNTAALMIAVILIGYSSYAALVIRSSAQTPMDQNSPDNVFSLKYYLNREQYGDRPLFYGQTYNAPVQLEVKGNMCIPVEKQGHAQYAPAPKVEGEKDRYVVTGYKTSYVFMDEFMMLFPRMYSSQASHVQAYKEWAEVKGKRVRYDYCGQQKTEYCPTFGENLRFFFRYQVNFMYWRYFMWNFAGRQNDLQSYGDLSKGNWISGIPFIDNAMLGDQSKLPTELRENKGHNVYYMLPLLLGLIGIVWQCGKRTASGEREGWKSFTLTFLLFFLTGLAIVIYLNQTPYQPRERDYAYAGSFYAFCIWIGLGVLALTDWVNTAVKNERVRAIIAVVIGIICLLVPAQMGAQNWDDHDRSGRYVCRDFGANYLKSCEKEAVIFCNGDNDTFPLWYNQEVEEVGTDIRACNLSYLQTDWYIDAMKRPYYDSPGLPISWEYKDYMPGKNEIAWVDNRLGPVSVDKAFTFLRSDDPRTKNREGENYLPSNQLYVETPSGEHITFRSARRYTRSEMMIMEMLSQNSMQGWKRPFYFVVTAGNDYYLGLEPYMELTGMAYRVTTERSADGQPRVNTEVMYDNMMHKFAYGNVNQPGIYIDENTMRMCRTHRLMFTQLAEALIREGKREKALEVLDYAEEVLPGYNVPYDYTSASMASMYLMLGETEKGNAILDKVAQNSVEYVEWCASLNKSQRAASQGVMEHHLAVLGYVLQSLDRYHQDELVEKYYPVYEQYARR
ncbi:MAG: protein O-mannosyl-transferase family [Paludibacteraceae bacterium]